MEITGKFKKNLFPSKHITIFFPSATSEITDLPRLEGIRYKNLKN